MDLIFIFISLFSDFNLLGQIDFCFFIYVFFLLLFIKDKLFYFFRVNFKSCLIFNKDGIYFISLF